MIAWQATIHRAEKNQIWLKWLSTHANIETERWLDLLLTEPVEFSQLDSLGLNSNKNNTNELSTKGGLWAHKTAKSEWRDFIGCYLLLSCSFHLLPLPFSSSSFSSSSSSSSFPSCCFILQMDSLVWLGKRVSDKNSFSGISLVVQLRICLPM